MQTETRTAPSAGAAAESRPAASPRSRSSSRNGCRSDAPPPRDSPADAGLCAAGAATAVLSAAATRAAALGARGLGASLGARASEAATSAAATATTAATTAAETEAATQSSSPATVAPPNSPTSSDTVSVASVSATDADADAEAQNRRLLGTTDARLRTPPVDPNATAHGRLGSLDPSIGKHTVRHPRNVPSKVSSSSEDADRPSRKRPPLRFLPSDSTADDRYVAAVAASAEPSAGRIRDRDSSLASSLSGSESSDEPQRKKARKNRSDGSNLRPPFVQLRDNHRQPQCQRQQATQNRHRHRHPHRRTLSPDTDPPPATTAAAAATTTATTTTVTAADHTSSPASALFVAQSTGIAVSPTVPSHKPQSSADTAESNKADVEERATSGTTSSESDHSSEQTEFSDSSSATNSADDVSRISSDNSDAVAAARRVASRPSAATVRNDAREVYARQNQTINSFLQSSKYKKRRHVEAYDSQSSNGQHAGNTSGEQPDTSSSASSGYTSSTFN